MVVGKDSSFAVVKFNKIMKTTDFFENITNRAFFEDKIFPNEMEALNDRIWKMGDTCNVVDTFEFPKTDMVLNLNMTTLIILLQIRRKGKSRRKM